MLYESKIYIQRNIEVKICLCTCIYSGAIADLQKRIEREMIRKIIDRKSQVYQAYKYAKTNMEYTTSPDTRRCPYNFNKFNSNYPHDDHANLRLDIICE